VCGSPSSRVVPEIRPAPLALQVEGEPVPRVSLPLAGGAAASDGPYLAALDLQGDRLILFEEHGEIREVHFPSGWAPGAVAMEGGQAAITLRGTGAVALVTVQPLQVELWPACPEPRGVDLRDGRWAVACAGGELVLPDRVLRVKPDLGEVLLEGDEAWLTVAREASVLRVSLQDGALLQQHALPVVPDLEGRALVARAARRMVRVGDGRVAVLHQAHTTDEIALSLVPGQPPYGTGACQAVARPLVTWLDAQGPTESVRIDAVLPVELAFWEGDGAFAEPTPVIGAGQGLTSAYPPSGLADPVPYCVPRGTLLATEGFVTGLTVGAWGVVAVTRSPFTVQSTDETLLGSEPAPADPGFVLFHQASPSGLSCASCHLGGREDGHVWRFAGMGERRTQSLAGGLLSTAPYHWDGSLLDLAALFADTGVARMGLPPANEADLASLGAWLDALPAPISELQQAPGEELFLEQCAGCHEPPSPVSADVGTGGSFQAPSLDGVGARLPLMHDGCAETLYGRFEPDCGGDRHGGPLSEAQIEALVQYLRSR
jgi:mono/diheme cytochrome c family protein